MLSDVDIRRELGRGITIHPFYPLNIEGGSVYVTASDLAWSVTSKLKISSGERIIIPKNDTALIISRECIALSNKYAGSCHSRVSMAAKGLSHISTPMKPGTCSRLLLSLHNNTNNDIAIGVGDKIAVIMFDRLYSGAQTNLGKANTDPVVLGNLGITLDGRDADELTECSDQRELKYRMCESDDYKRYMKRFSHKTTLIGGIAWALVILLAAQIPLLFLLPNVQFQGAIDALKITTTVTATCTGVLFGKLIP